MLEPDLVGQQFQAQVLVGLVLECLQKAIIQNRQVGLRQSCRFEDVEHAFGFDVLIDQIADGLVEFPLLRLLPRCGLANLVTNRLHEDDFIGIGLAIVEVFDQEECHGQFEFGFQKLLAEFVGFGEVAIDQRGEVFFLDRVHPPLAAVAINQPERANPQTSDLFSVFQHRALGAI